MNLLIFKIILEAIILDLFFIGLLILIIYPVIKRNSKKNCFECAHLSGSSRNHRWYCYTCNTGFYGSKYNKHFERCEYFKKRVQDRKEEKEWEY